MKDDDECDNYDDNDNENILVDDDDDDDDYVVVVDDDDDVANLFVETVERRILPRVPDELEDGDDDGERQSHEENDEDSADVGDAERRRFVVLLLFVADADSGVLPPLVVEDLNATVLLQLQYRHRNEVAIRRTCKSSIVNCSYKSGLIHFQFECVDGIFLYDIGIICTLFQRFIHFDTFVIFNQMFFKNYFFKNSQLIIATIISIMADRSSVLINFDSYLHPFAIYFLVLHPTVRRG